MNNVFLGEPSQYIRNWFVKKFYWPTYTTLEFVDGTTQTKEINGVATWEKIGVKSSQYDDNYTLTQCQLGTNVTEISSRAFSYCTFLTSIYIPNSVTSIGSEAFYYCTSLTSIDIPSTISTFKYCTFSDCQSLTSITFKSTIETLEQGALSGNVNLLSVIGTLFPYNGLIVNNIKYGAFYNCKSLKSLYIDADSISSIETDAFYGCSSLTSIFFVYSQGSQNEVSSRISSMVNYPFGADPSIIKMARGEPT